MKHYFFFQLQIRLSALTSRNPPAVILLILILLFSEDGNFVRGRNGVKNNGVGNAIGSGDSSSFGVWSRRYNHGLIREPERDINETSCNITYNLCPLLQLLPHNYYCKYCFYCYYFCLSQQSNPGSQNKKNQFENITQAEISILSNSKKDSLFNNCQYFSTQCRINNFFVSFDGISHSFFHSILLLFSHSKSKLKSLNFEENLNALRIKALLHLNRDIIKIHYFPNSQSIDQCHHCQFHHKNLSPFYNLSALFSLRIFLFTDYKSSQNYSFLSLFPKYLIDYLRNQHRKRKINLIEQNTQLSNQTNELSEVKLHSITNSSTNLNCLFVLNYSNDSQNEILSRKLRSITHKLSSTNSNTKTKHILNSRAEYLLLRNISSPTLKDNKISRKRNTNYCNGALSCKNANRIIWTKYFDGQKSVDIFWEDMTYYGPARFKPPDDLIAQYSIKPNLSEGQYFHIVFPNCSKISFRKRRNIYARLVFFSRPNGKIF